jgi:PrtD family type I secretion system ABC transporter
MVEKNSLQVAYGKFRVAFIATMVFSFFLNLLMFVGPLYMLQIYDRVLSSRNETTLVMLTVIAMVLLISFGILDYIRSKLLIRAGAQFDEVLAKPVFHRVVKQQIAAPGSSGHVALSDVDKVREFLTGNGIISFFDAPWVPLFLALCFAFHPWLGIVATSGAVIIFILALMNEFGTRKLLQEAGQSGQGAQHFASTTMQNAEVIRAMGMEAPLAKRWQSQHDRMLADLAVASGRASMVVSSSKFVRMSLQVFILGVGAYLALMQQITPGIMIAASIVMGRALAPVEQSVGQWKQFVAARQSHRRLKTLFESIEDDKDRTELPAPTGKIVVDRLLAFRPGTRDALLKNVSFDIAPGEVLALIGPSGSGKSTLVRHLVGALHPASGTVRLDGTEIGHWDVAQLGKYIGYLPQDVQLFAGTVVENISRFQENADDSDTVAAARLAGAHEMIQNLPDGYETNLGVSGGSLSGGQRQRVGLARAVFGSPKLVVLDEPNAHLDSVGEKALLSCIEALKESGATVVLVTHKANLLAVSDKTLMLVDGAVEKFGPTASVFQQQNAEKTAAVNAAAKEDSSVVKLQKT